jgi:hypothetical protein
MKKRGGEKGLGKFREWVKRRQEEKSTRLARRGEIGGKGGEVSNL